MNIKEAFRYQNYLQKMFDRANGYITSRGNVMRKTQKHLRQKTNPDARDEEIDVTPDRDLDCSPDMVIKYILAIIDEMYMVDAAIAEAKAYSTFRIDAEVSKNKRTRQIVSTLRYLRSFKAMETVSAGTGYKFNAEGNQVAYNYDVQESLIPEFDHVAIRKLHQTLSQDADSLSDGIDRFVIDTVVPVVPAFDISEEFQDSVESFIARKEYERHAV